MESFTACEMATVSPSGFLVTDRASVSLPLVRVMEVRTSSLMLTSATLPMVAASLAPPSGRALTASRESTGLPICSESVLPCSSMVPAGISAPLFFSALLMDWMVAPLARHGLGAGQDLDVLGGAAGDVGAADAVELLQPGDAEPLRGRRSAR